LGTLGAINPVPFVVGMYCTLGWLLYGCLLRDGFIMWANFVPLGVLHFCTQNVLILLSNDVLRAADSVKETSYRKQLIAKKASEDASGMDVIAEVGMPMASSSVSEASLLSYVEIGLWAAPPIWGLVAYFAWVVWEDDRAYAVKVVGWICVLQTAVYFTAPLSFIREVVRLGDASSIYPPSILANAGNCCMWLVYGWFAIKDPMVWAPNLFGLLLQVVNTLLVMWYPRLLAKQAAERLTQEDQNLAACRLGMGGGGGGALLGKEGALFDSDAFKVEVEVPMVTLGAERKI